MRDAVAAVSPRLDAAGLDWGGLDDFLTLRGELLELDVRWGLPGPLQVRLCATARDLETPCWSLIDR